MSALLKKEIRLLLPSFIAAGVAALSVWLLRDERNSTSEFRTFVTALPFLLSPALAVMLALDSFGCEISAGTFSNLLSQPISRLKIWRMKTLLLAGAISFVWLTWWLSFVGNKNFAINPKELHEAFVATILFQISIFSGGLWTVLLLRQVAAAFWFTLLIPAMLALITMGIAEKFSISVEPSIVIVLSIYSIAGFVFARWLFLRAQDVAWTGGEIALPEIRRAARVKAAPAANHIWRPRRALFWKELQLHQSQFIIAGALALLHLAMIATRKFGNFKDSSTMEFILSGFWFLWFAMPLVVGCAAVAEERKLGTLEAQLCLPVRRRTQFLIKLFSAILLSLSLSIAIPLLLEGPRIFPDLPARNVSEIAKAFPTSTFAIGLTAVLSFIYQLLPVMIRLELPL